MLTLIIFIVFMILMPAILLLIGILSLIKYFHLRHNEHDSGKRFLVVGIVSILIVGMVLAGMLAAYYKTHPWEYPIYFKLENNEKFAQQGIIYVDGRVVLNKTLGAGETSGDSWSELGKATLNVGIHTIKVTFNVTGSKTTKINIDNYALIRCISENGEVMFAIDEGYGAPLCLFSPLSSESEFQTEFEMIFIDGIVEEGLM